MPTIEISWYTKLWNFFLHISVLPWKGLSWMMKGKVDPKPKEPVGHECSKHTATRLTHELVSPGQDKYTRLHSYGIDDLVESVVRSCCRDDQTKLTAIQQQARDQFLDAYLSYTDDISEEQLLHLMRLLDIIFYAGALTQRGTELVRFKFLHYDAWSWNRVQWRLGIPEFLAYTDYKQMPLTKLTIIAISRVFGGRRYTKKQIVDILAHEMIHAFLALYWDWCPGENEVTLQGGPNTHGETFLRIVREIYATMGLWHPSLEGLGCDDDITAPLPGRWLERTKKGFAIIAAIQRGLLRVICWHEDMMIPELVHDSMV